MRKGIVFGIVILLLVSSVFALEKGKGIIGSGSDSDPYVLLYRVGTTTTPRDWGVTEYCSVRIYSGSDPLLESPIWLENTEGIIKGDGSRENPFRKEGEPEGIVCIFGNIVEKTYVGEPAIFRGETEAEQTSSTGTQTPTPSEPTPSQFGCKTNRCKEIDEVWLSFQGLLKNFAVKFPDRVNKIFDKIQNWVSFNDVYETRSSPSSGEIPAQTSTKDIQDVKQAAQAILNSPNVKFWDGLSTGSDRQAFENLAQTGKTIVPATQGTVTPSLQMMKALVEMARDGPIMINALTGGVHSRGSSHYKGMAVDLDISIGNAARIETIARKYGGTRNSETNHIHLDFPGASGTTTTSSICVATEGTSYQRALLDTIAWAEGTNEKYNIMFGNRQFIDYSAHPAITGQMPPEGFPFSGGKSTAAGRYQFLKSTYDDLKGKGYFSTGFGPQEQDKAALYLIETKRKLSAAELENLARAGSDTAIWNKLKDEWTSLTTKNNQNLLTIFNSCLRSQQQ